MTKNLTKTIVKIFIAVVLVTVLVAGFAMYTEYVQYKEIGEAYTSVYMTNLTAMAATYVVSFLVLFVTLTASSLIALSAMRRRGVVVFEKKFPVVLINILIAMLLSFAIGKLSYEQVLVSINGVSFGMADPVFGMDIGYYLFSRPFLVLAANALSIVVLANFAYIAFIYLALYAKLDVLSVPKIIKEKDIMLHAAVNILLFVLVKAFQLFLDRANMLYGSVAGVTGAGYVDKLIWKPYYIIAPFLLIAVAVLAVVFLSKSRYKAAVKTVLVFPAFVVVAFLASAAIQAFYVNPAEIRVESENIAANIEATRHGYGLDEITESTFDLENNLTSEDISQNRDIVDNIRITDVRATLTASNTLQATRGYYSFIDSDIVPYEINGRITAMNTSVRELDKSKLTEQNYINQRLRYTHGYGVVMNPVNKVTAQGQPDYLVKDVPVVSTGGAPKVTRPEIYFGEMTKDYVIAGSGYKELSYMREGSPVETSYEGTAGIPMTMGNRLLFALKELDWNMLISSYVNADSRLLINRDIITRAKKIAPYLSYTNDPYIVVDNAGRLKWVIDAYTTSDKYPYGQYYNGVNYIRNSVKVIIDAYDGTTDFYIVDADDPIIKTYASIYPGVFKSEPLPDGVREHIAYPENYFNMQAEVYKRYHVTDPETFYSKSDIWNIAMEKFSDGESVPIEPYYSVIRLKEGEELDLVLMLPYTPSGKENMVGWMGAIPRRISMANWWFISSPRASRFTEPCTLKAALTPTPTFPSSFPFGTSGGQA